MFAGSATWSSSGLTSSVRYFGTSEEFWMNLQSNYELRLERRAAREQVAAITPLRVA